MSYARPQRHRTDGNQSPLIELFESLGGYWIPYASKPFDGWAWHPKFGFKPVEIKNSAGHRRKGAHDEFSPRQRKVMEEMLRAGASWLIWREESDVYACVGARRTA